MNRPEAIETLEAIAMAESTFSDAESKKCCEAIDLAVKALKKEQSGKQTPLSMEQLRGDCEKCAHYRVTWNGCTPDFECQFSDRCLNRDLWEWRGIKEE